MGDTLFDQNGMTKEYNNRVKEENSDIRCSLFSVVCSLLLITWQAMFGTKIVNQLSQSNVFNQTQVTQIVARFGTFPMRGKPFFNLFAFIL